MTRFTMLAAALFVLTGTSHVRGEDPAETAKLKREIELLKKENALLSKEVELLKKEVDQLKKAAPEPGGAERSETPANLKAVLGDDVEYELLQCVRDPKKKTQVAFTFGLKSEKGMPLHYAPHQLSLTDDDGAAITVKVVKGLPTKADIIGVERAAFNLPKGQVIKFQIIVDGLKEGATSIDRVELTAPPRGLVTDKVTFTSVKVTAAKK